MSVYLCLLSSLLDFLTRKHCRHVRHLLTDHILVCYFSKVDFVFSHPLTVYARVYVCVYIQYFHAERKCSLARMPSVGEYFPHCQCIHESKPGMGGGLNISMHFTPLLILGSPTPPSKHQMRKDLQRVLSVDVVYLLQKLPLDVDGLLSEIRSHRLKWLILKQKTKTDEKERDIVIRSMWRLFLLSN